MSYAVTVKGLVTTVETLTNGDLAATQTLVHTGYDDTASLDADSSPAVTKVAYQSTAMSTGAATLDLTSLTLNSLSVTLSGLHLRVVKVKAPTTNSAAVTVAKGASNGLTALGSAFSVTLQPGAWFELYDPSGLAAAVDATHKTLDVTGTGTDAVQLSVAAG